MIADPSKGERCPTCGAEVRVVGRTTRHYEPVAEADTLPETYDELWALAYRYREALERLAANDAGMPGRIASLALAETREAQ